MIHFEYLSDQEGTGRYGNCASCGKFYNEDPKMVRLTFIRDDSTRGHEICLCDECRKLLCSEITRRKDWRMNGDDGVDREASGISDKA